MGISPEWLKGDTNVLNGYSAFKNVFGVPGSGKILQNIKRVTELNGGTLEAESEYGKGTKFRIILPGKKLVK